MTNILFIGDIVGKSGRSFLISRLSFLLNDLKVDFAIANGENAAAGFGITPAIAMDLFEAGIHVLTTGNHVWYRKEIIGFLEEEPCLLRPANYPDSNPGRGSGIFKARNKARIGVVNINGRVFMEPLDCPFQTLDRELSAMEGKTDIILVDLHAEATSEKMAMARYFQGRVSAVIGTHTHVQTADEAILPGGTAFISDAGMTGVSDSVIGMKSEIAIQRFLTHIPDRLEPAKGPATISGVLVCVEENDGKAVSISRILVRE